MNRIIHTSVILLSLSGFIACSELEAIKPKASGQPTFSEPTPSGGGSAASVDVCALAPSLLVDAGDLSLQAQTDKSVTLLRSTQSLLNQYGVDLSCFTDTFTGPVYEIATAKFKLHDIIGNNAEFLLNVTIHEIDKTYHFDSKNAISTSVRGDGTTEIFELTGAIVGAKVFADFEFEKDTLSLELTKTDAAMNEWTVSIKVIDKTLTELHSLRRYELGTFKTNLENISRF